MSCLKLPEKINMVASFMSPIFTVTSKTAVQYIILPFMYQHVSILGQPIHWLLSKGRISHLYKIFDLSTLKVTSKMACNRYISLYELQILRIMYHTNLFT